MGTHFNINEQTSTDEAVKEDALVCQSNDPSEADQIAAVQKDAYLLLNFKEPSEAVQLAAVQRSPWLVEYIKNPSEAVLLAAVQTNGHGIQYIKTPSETVQLTAVRQDGHAIHQIQNPSEAVQLAALFSAGVAAASWWSPDFRPTAATIKLALQDSVYDFSSGVRRRGSVKGKHFEAGIRAIQSCLVHQPATDILDLAALAPALFDPPELREILRDALLDQADPAKGLPGPRPI